MLYKSLYRTYRPLKFEEVYGQKHIIKILKNSIKNNNINHAYIFFGNRGTGKTSVAKIFAKNINCLDLKDGEACGKCDVCRTNIDQMQDIIEIDAASNNGVDEIREINTKINFVPNKTKYKVYIIDEVHMLSMGAFNALLKTLEEPPKHVVFILATTEVHKIPLTILSRCQRLDFKNLEVLEIENKLEEICKKEKIKYEKEVLGEISRISSGSLRDAIVFLEQLSIYSDNDIKLNDLYDLTGTISNKEIYDFIEKLKNNDIEGALNFFDYLNENAKDFEKISNQMLFILKEILLYKKAPKYIESKKEKVSKDFINLSNSIDEERLIEVINNLNNVLIDLKTSNYQALTFQLFIIKNLNENIGESNIIKEEEQPNIIKEVIKEEPKEEKIENIVCDEYKKILINNTLALANKEQLKKLQIDIKDCKKFLTDKKYKETASILSDCKVVAASETHILITYDHQSIVDMHDSNLKKIENLIKELTDKKYKIVAITDEFWKKTRPYYVELKEKNKKIELLDEKTTAPMLREEPTIKFNDTINLFGEDIVEMED